MKKKSKSHYGQSSQIPGSLSSGSSRVFKKSLDKTKQAFLDCLTSNGYNNSTGNTKIQSRKKLSDSNIRKKKSKELYYDDMKSTFGSDFSIVIKAALFELI